MTEIEAGFYKCLIKCVLVFFVVFIIAITTYNLVDVAGPVRPRQSSIYYWPPSMGLNIPGNNNQAGNH